MECILSLSSIRRNKREPTEMQYIDHHDTGKPRKNLYVSDRNSHNDKSIVSVLSNTKDSTPNQKREYISPAGPTSSLEENAENTKEGVNLKFQLMKKRSYSLSLWKASWSIRRDETRVVEIIWVPLFSFTGGEPAFLQNRLYARTRKRIIKYPWLPGGLL